MSGLTVILGGTGYVGRLAIQALVAAGMPVTVVARRVPARPAAGISFLACDARDRRALAAAIAGAETVLNAIAAPPPSMVAVAASLAAVAPASVRRIVHISSLAVFSRSRGSFSEMDTPNPAAMHPYAHAKYRAEQALLAMPAIAARTVILRPGCIFGPAAPIWSDRIGRLLLTGRLGLLGRAGNGWCGIVDVRDVVRSLLYAVDAEADVAGIHHLISPHRLSWNEFFGCYAEQLGVTASIIGPARIAAETLYALAANSDADRITPNMLRLFRRRAAAVSTRPPLLTVGAFVPLATSLSEAAASLLSRRAVVHAMRPAMAIP